MTREEAKELLPIIQAFADGKTIEIYDDKWKTMIFEDPHFDCAPSRYRIKPGTKYRPFKKREECWNEMLKHQPFGWLKSKKNGCFYCIGELALSEEFEDFIIIFSTDESLSHYSDYVYREYTFADNSPFGIKEE